MRNFKKQNAITLIALIVTIIVLLILAGVSLSLVAGSNGILSKAEKAVEATNEAIILEEVEMAISEGSMEYYLSDRTQTLTEYLAENFSPYETGSGAQINFLADGNILYESKNGGITLLEMDANGQVIITEKDGSTVTRTVTYNANGGTGNVPEAQTVEYKGTVNVDFSTLPTKEGYSFLGWATTNNASSTNYSENGTKSFVMGTSNVILYAVWQDISVDPDNYGDSANYSSNGIEDWKIFLNDGSNIYLIASDYVSRSKLNMTEGVVAGNGEYCVKGTSRDGLLNWITKTNNWDDFVAEEFKEETEKATATGGPTLEQFWTSYNSKYGTSYSAGEDVSNHVGYSDRLYFPHTWYWNDVYAYWFASLMEEIEPNCLGHARCSGLISYYYWAQPMVGVRPLVKLPAGLSAKKESDGKWTFLQEL